MTQPGVPATLIRIGFALAILSFLAIGEKYFLRDRAYRWRGYSIWLSVALICSGFGFLVDMLTVRMSPEYFSIGKNAKLDFVWLDCLNNGGVSGLLAGAVVGAILVIRSRDLINVTKHVPWKLLLFVFPVLLGAVLGGAVANSIPLLAASDEGTKKLVSFRTIDAFYRVKQIHSGIYVGGELGFILIMVKFKEWFRLL